MYISAALLILLRFFSRATLKTLANSEGGSNTDSKTSKADLELHLLVSWGKFGNAGDTSGRLCG
ncbi:uncharacterized protein PHALS_15114 [Plasmopara halstedii]|uniref:RxLR-like protein n=1 Tax=Plasmopara halstedii TaxID=4781 RepID=A0A0P1AB23_PLAHL|nr:uncharacterized protein PHALS_15114 [Plasmopara halstedii]CEG37728.1 hypothetical protein PHALS_15114 [Plasmopara halstedii]|eukprot:XP_024574097.1 hypothetical protein PHALS_15114 [Plasmopara halstedii]